MIDPVHQFRGACLGIESIPQKDPIVSAGQPIFGVAASCYGMTDGAVLYVGMQPLLNFSSFVAVR
jgi:hypothetical protein